LVEFRKEKWIKKKKSPWQKNKFDKEIDVKTDWKK
jgi:hypothetical protein